MVFISSTGILAGTANSIVITGLGSGTYASHRLIVHNLTLDTANRSIVFQASVDSGANYGSLWTHTRLLTGTTSVISTGTVGGSVPLGEGSTSGGTTGLSGTIDIIYGTATNNRTHAIFALSWYNYNPTYYVMRASGFYDSNSDINAVKFLQTNGEAANFIGTVRLYGISKT